MKLRVHTAYGFNRPVYQLEMKRTFGPWLIYKVFDDLGEAHRELGYLQKRSRPELKELYKKCY